MENKSLNCSVFFNPTDGKKNRSSNSKEKKKHFNPKVLSSYDKLFSITYVPEQFQKSPIKIVAHPGRSGKSHNEDGPLIGSSIDIEEFISPYSSGGLQMHYVIDDKVKCKTCWEMKFALDFTFQKLYLKSFKTVVSEGNETKIKEKFAKSHPKDGKVKPKFCTTPVIKEIEETGPLIKFFSRLLRSATINNMKKFSRDIEEKIAKSEMLATKRKTMLKVILKPNENLVKKHKAKMSSQFVGTCESCQRLQQALYATVSKLYEEVGIQTDFPTVQTLETYTFLVYPNDVENLPIACESGNGSKKRRHAILSPKDNKDIAEKTWIMKDCIKKKEDLIEEEKRNLLKLRVERHKAVFAASKYVHIIVALCVSITTISLILVNWLLNPQLYTNYIMTVTIALLLGCLYNAYQIVYCKSYSLKNYFIIPLCWILLAYSNGKCDDRLMPNNVCDSNIHFLSHIYLFIILLEYYVASGIHAVVVLEIDQFEKIPIKELLKYSVYNLPLMIIVLGYAVYRMFSELRRRYREKGVHISTNPENTEKVG